MSFWMNQKLLGFPAKRLLGRIKEAMEAAVVWRKVQRDGWVNMGFSFGLRPSGRRRHQTASIVTTMRLPLLDHRALQAGWRVSLGKLPSTLLDEDYLNYWGEGQREST